MISILAMEVQSEPDVVGARQRSRQIADYLGFKPQEQVGLATAVSEIARNAFQYAGGGTIEFLLAEDSPQILEVAICDQGPGIANLAEILDGQYQSPAGGLGLGIIGAQRLVDQFQIQSTPAGGTQVRLGKYLPKRSPVVTQQRLAQITEELTHESTTSLLSEVQRQNRELLQTLEELRARQAEVEQLNWELEETNRGVVALYAELDEKAEYLQRLSKLKSLFFSNMSHEFRTPLNSIRGLAQLLLDRADGELTPEQEKQVMFIYRSVDDLSALVNDLLDLAKIEAGKTAVYPSEFEVTTIFSALRGMFRPLVTSNAVTLIFEDPVGIPPLQTDEGKVSQILRNFIANALKFTEQGEIRVTAVMESDTAVVFSVQDTGIGIALDDQERIFEEFTQLDSVVQRQVKGTGLGLPLCQKLAQLLGGRVAVTSQPGVGSTFSAIIPLNYAKLAETSDFPNIIWPRDPERKPVLVVDDNLEILFTYEQYLKGSGFQVIPARSLSEARQVLEVVKPVAVVLEILLVRENSWTFISDIKTNEATRNIPLLVITKVDNQQKAVNLGADAFYIKPVSREWLVNTLTTLANQHLSQKILVIDDDDVSRYLLKKFFTDRPYDVLEAANGLDGLQLAQAEQPKVIFLDLVMPDMTGFEVLEALKADPNTCNIPVIINTSKVLHEEEYKHLSRSAVAILSKSNHSPETIHTSLESALLKTRISLNL